MPDTLFQQSPNSITSGIHQLLAQSFGNNPELAQVLLGGNDEELRRSGSPTAETIQVKDKSGRSKTVLTGRVGAAGTILPTRGPAGPIKKGGAREGLDFLNIISQIADRTSGKGGPNIRGAAALAKLGLGQVTLTKFFRDPNSPASMATLKGLLQGPGGVTRRLGKARIGNLEISAFTDKNTAKLARVIGATARSKARQKRKKGRDRFR